MKLSWGEGKEVRSLSPNAWEIQENQEVEVTLATQFQASLECMSPHLKKLEVNKP